MVAGRHHEVLSFVLRPVYPKELGDQASKMSWLWDSIWTERCANCLHLIRCYHVTDMGQPHFLLSALKVGCHE